MEWNEAVTATKEGAPSIQKILNKAFKRAAAVLVLLTPDDEARLHRRFRRRSDSSQLEGQPRLNVIFEAGMAWTSHPKRTVFVEVGDVRAFTDVAGLHMVRMEDTAAKRRELATKLQAAGLKVNLDGTRWTTAGNFAAALAAAAGRRPRRR